MVKPGTKASQAVRLEIVAAHLGYLSLLSGNVGYTYGSNLWDATDADLPAWKALPGATYLQYLYDFFVALDEGRPLQPRHELIKNQATRYQDRILGVSTDGMTYAAFLPNGATIDIDLTALAGTTVGVTWYNPSRANTSIRALYPVAQCAPPSRHSRAANRR